MGTDEIITPEQASAMKGAGIVLTNRLRCMGDGCSALLKLTDRHSIKASSRYVSPFFSLKSSAQSPHVNGCIFNIDAVTKISARRAPMLIVAIRNKANEFRLNILAHVLNGDVSKLIPPSDRRDDLKHPGIRYQHIGVLTSYLRGAQDVVRLAVAYNLDTLDRDIIIRFGDETIGWENFYFKAPRFPECFAWVNCHRTETSNGHPTKIPIAVEGKIAKILENGHIRLRVHDPHTTEGIVPVVHLHLSPSVQSYFKNLREGDLVLAIGLASTSSAPRGTTIYHNIHLGVQYTAQVHPIRAE